MESDPVQNNKTTQSTDSTDTQTSNLIPSENLNDSKGTSPDPQIFGAQPRQSRKLQAMKVILICLLIPQILTSVLTLYTAHDTRNANDFSGLAVLVFLMIHVLLISFSIVLYGFYILGCRKKQVKHSLATTVLLVVSFSALILSVVLAPVLGMRDPPYGGYEHASCSNQECMSQHFRRCALVDYTAKATVSPGTPDEAIATTDYSIFSTTEEFGCRISIKTHIETSLVTLADGSKSQRTLKDQTLYCQAHPGMDFEQYIQQVLDDPSQHKCI